MSSDTVLRIEQLLNGANYELWSILIRGVLRRRKLLQTIKSPDEHGDEKPSCEQLEEAFELMLTNMRVNIALRYQHLNNPYKLWVKLQNDFGITTISDIRHLVRELVELQYNGDIKLQVSRLQQIKQYLDDSRLSISTIIDIIFLDKLPGQFQNVVNTLLCQPVSELNTKTIEEKLRDVEAKTSTHFIS